MIELEQQLLIGGDIGATEMRHRAFTVDPDEGRCENRQKRRALSFSARLQKADGGRALAFDRSTVAIRLKRGRLPCRSRLVRRSERRTLAAAGNRKGNQREKKDDAARKDGGAKKDGEIKQKDGDEDAGKDHDKDKADKEKADKPKPVEIDFEDIERRAMPLPVPAGAFGRIAVADGKKLVYVRLPARGSSDSSTGGLASPEATASAGDSASAGSVAAAPSACGAVESSTTSSRPGR